MTMFTWWNAIYSLPLAVVLVFLAVTSLISLVGGVFGQFGDADTEVDADADVHAGAHGDLSADGGVEIAHAGGHHGAEADLGLDVDTDLGVDAGADAPHVHGAECGHAAGHHGASPVMEALAFLGVGQAPLVMVLEVWLLLWGLIGVGLHQAFGAAGPGALVWSLPMTFLLSVGGTRGFAKVFGRFFKPIETSALRRDQIVGLMGRVVFPVTEEQGTVHVRDKHGTLHRLRARSEHGRLESGQQIIVLGYDPANKLYQVDDSSAFVDR
jgi:membrane protein implicated in regulation of membrane protease activity